MAAPLINTRYEILETVPSEDASSFVVSKARDVTEGRVVTLQVLPVDGHRRPHGHARGGIVGDAPGAPQYHARL